MSSQNEDDTTAISNDDNSKSLTGIQKRRVHFPTDESQLRMISIAPEPLSNQPLYSLGVILQRYRAACQRLQIKPLNCLLDQLSTMEDGRKSFNDRLNCLKISNERLDIKHIDAIEEILSRCRFYTLDVESSFTDDLTLVQLFDVIEYYESCIHLNLSNNRSINAQGYQALTRYLKRTRCLERLDMNSMRFDDLSMLGFGRSLRISTTLYELHLESCQLNGKILQKFIQNLRLCCGLRELYLCDNRLQVQDSLLINDLIRTCGQTLHALDLRSNALQDTGMSHISSQLSQYDEHHTHQNSIYKLSFQSNQITTQGIGFLAKSLLHNRTVHSLNLSHNPITNEGLFLLRDTLLTNRTINELILRNCRLTDQSAIALAEYIAESSSIQYIDLRENNIQASGICGLAIAMKNNKSLLGLQFDQVIPISANANVPLTTNNANNIDRPTGNSSSLLSLSNLRRMTVGFGAFGSHNSNSSDGGDPSIARELLEQKLKWINDIECICERNLLLYEDRLRQQQAAAEQQQQQQQNGHSIENSSLVEGETDQNQESFATENDILLEENITDSIQLNGEDLLTSKDDDNNNNNNDDVFINQADNENPGETQISTNESHKSTAVPINTNDNVKEFADNQPNHTNNDLVKQENSENHDDLQASTDEYVKSIEMPINNGDVDGNKPVESVPCDNNGNVQTAENPIEFELDGSIDDDREGTDLNKESTLPGPSVDSDQIENNSENVKAGDNDGDDNDDLRKLHHSDSLYILRKKVQQEEDNTSDDESELSSCIEQQKQQQQTDTQGGA